MPTTLRHPRTLLILLALLCYLPGFFTLPPSDRDEARFAQSTHQMLETGDFVQIREGPEARNKKPIGIYWLQAPFAAAFGPRAIWPYRIPSLLGALTATLATFALGRRLFDRRTAFLAAAMLGTCILLTTEAHIAKTDAALLAATTLAMFALSRAYLATATAPTAALFWLATGAGILLKGPITPMVAGLAALTLCLWDRRARWLLSLRPAWGIPLCLATILPWFIAIGLATHGQFFRDALGGDLLSKLAHGAESHWGPPGLHLFLLPLLLFPATTLLPAGLLTAWQTRTIPATRFLVAWAAPAWLVFEAVPTKLPHYPLPLYPALCLLAASAIPTPLTLRLGRILATIVATLIALAALALPILLHAPLWLGLPGAAAALLLLVLTLRTPPYTAILAAPLLYWSLLGLELPHLSPLWLSPRAIAAVHTLPQGPLGAISDHEPSLRFLGGTSTLFLPDGPSGATALANHTVTRLLVGDRDLPAFQAAATRDHLTPHAITTIRGFNYSRGRWITLTLFTP